MAVSYLKTRPSPCPPYITTMDAAVHGGHIGAWCSVVVASLAVPRTGPPSAVRCVGSPRHCADGVAVSRVRHCGVQRPAVVPRTLLDLRCPRSAGRVIIAAFPRTPLAMVPWRWLWRECQVVGVTGFLVLAAAGDRRPSE